MKKTTLILSAMLMLMAIGCKKSETFTLRGQIQNADSAVITMHDWKTSQTDTIRLVNGDFDTNFVVTTPGFRWINFGGHDKMFFLAPGYNISLKADLKNFYRTVILEGKGATENNILDSVKNHLQWFDYRTLQTKTPAGQIAAYDSATTSQMAVLSNLCEGKTVDPLFISFMETKITFWGAEAKVLTCLNNDSTDRAFLTSLNTEAPEWMEIDEYRHFLSLNKHLEARKIAKNDSIKPSDEFSKNNRAMMKFLESLSNQNIKEYLTFDYLRTHLGYYGAENLTAMVEFFNSFNTNSSYQTIIHDLNEKQKLLAKGQPAPVFSFRDADSNLVSLSDFKGKIVFLDFWATWCGGCIKEMPKLSELQKSFKDKEIAFVSVSLDGNKADWKNFLEKNKNDLINLYADNPNDPAIENYQIHGLPTFILIDREGRILGYNKYSPSDESLKPLLDSLLSI